LLVSFGSFPPSLQIGGAPRTADVFQYFAGSLFHLRSIAVNRQKQSDLLDMS
jgi:hypothetical protein